MLYVDHAHGYARFGRSRKLAWEIPTVRIGGSVKLCDASRRDMCENRHPYRQIDIFVAPHNVAPFNASSLHQYSLMLPPKMWMHCWLGTRL